MEGNEGRDARDGRDGREGRDQREGKSVPIAEGGSEPGKETEVDEVRQLRKWVQVLRKQCQVYEDVIAKMDHKLIQVNQDFHKLSVSFQVSNGSLKTLEKVMESMQSAHRQQVIRLQQTHSKQIKELKQGINRIMQAYSSLESEYRRYEIQWQIMKQKCQHQKQHKICNLNTQIETTLSSSLHCPSTTKLKQQQINKIQYEYDNKNNNIISTLTAITTTNSSSNQESRYRYRGKSGHNSSFDGSYGRGID